MINSLLLMIVLLLGSACSMTNKQHALGSQNLGVNLESDNNRQTPTVENSSKVNSVGPVPKENDYQVSNERIKEPVLALVYPDDENSIVNAIKLQRELRKIRIQPRVYAGVGIGVVAATAFAFDMTPDEIEWELFALEREGIHKLDAKAKKVIEKYNNKDISQSFHVLNIQTSKGVWVKRGKIDRLVIPHIDRKSEDKWELRVPLNKFDADIIHVVDGLDALEHVEVILKKIKEFKNNGY